MSDPEEVQKLSAFLSRSGFQVDVEQNGTHVFGRVSSSAYDLMVIHSRMSEADGFTILRRIRIASAIPILLITGNEGWQDRVLGLTLGADDCLPSAFQEEELLVRIAAILRRAPAPSIPQPFRVGDFEVFPGSRQACYRAKSLDLTAMECQILELLMRECGRTVTRDQISLHLYGRPTSPIDRTIDTHMSRIRRKIGEAGRLIKSVRGCGYQLCAADPHANAPGSEAESDEQSQISSGIAPNS